MRKSELTSVPKWFLAVSPRTFFPTIDTSAFDMFGIDHGFLWCELNVIEVGDVPREFSKK
jgi:hypothetical protein